LIESTTSLPPFDHERVETAVGPRSGLTITVALHSSVLGPALGGCRVWTYPTWLDSVSDALRLASAMTMKNAAAGLNAGGGKSVIRLAPGETLDADRRTAALLDLGDVVEHFEGRYLTAEDVGTSAEDMLVVARRTAHVVGLPATAGGTGDPSGPTSIGVLAGLGATLRALYGTDQFEGRSFVVAGLGHVGTRIAARLAAEGGVVTVADVDPGKRRVADSLGVRWVEPDEAHTVEADVFVPSGVGGVLTETVIRELGARAVVGPANNPLADRAGADLLHDSGVLYAPDFVVNAGGAIYLTLAAAGVDGREIDRRLEGIGDTVSRVYEDAAAAGTTPLVAAEELAFARLRGERVNA
jgi:leucine dehydrogenase